MGQSGDDRNDTTLEGGTDGTTIGNVSDRLKVAHNAAPGSGYPLIPADKVVYGTSFLEKAGASEMSVDGSVTPQVFTAGPGAGETWYVCCLDMGIYDVGNNDWDAYGSIASGLTNGVDIEWTVNSTDYLYANIKNNATLVHYLGSMVVIGSGSGFLHTPNYTNLARQFQHPTTLIGDDGDQVKVTINDDLTVLDHMGMTVIYYRVI